MSQTFTGRWGCPWNDLPRLWKCCTSLLYDFKIWLLNSQVTMLQGHFGHVFRKCYETLPFTITVMFSGCSETFWRGNKGFHNSLPSPQKISLIRTLEISTGDAVLHFAVEPRVFIPGSECPHPRPWLTFSHLKRSLVGSGKSGCHVIYIQDVHQHLKRGQEGSVKWELVHRRRRSLIKCRMHVGGFLCALFCKYKYECSSSLLC